MERERWCWRCFRRTRHDLSISPELPWDEWGPLALFVHALRVIFEYLFEAWVCVECEKRQEQADDDLNEPGA